MMRGIAAVICTYNRYDVLEKAIESLDKQTLDKRSFKIMVIDNSPDHQCAKAFGEQFSGIKNLEYVIEKTPGLSNARNVAAAVCDTEFISYMDDDAIAKPDWVEKIMGAFEKFGKSCEVVGGRVDPIWEIPRPSWLGPKIEGYISIVNWGGNMRKAEESEWFAGTNISFRVSTLLSLGGFSQNLGRNGGGGVLLSNEEKQLVDAIREKGGKLVYQPEAMVDHLVEKKRLTRQWFRKRVSWQATSDFLLDAASCIQKTKDQWSNILDYTLHLPPTERSLRGVMFDTDDPELFRWQLSAIYGWTLLNHAGFEGVELC